MRGVSGESAFYSPTARLSNIRSIITFWLRGLTRPGFCAIVETSPNGLEPRRDSHTERHTLTRMA